MQGAFGHQPLFVRKEISMTPSLSHLARVFCFILIGGVLAYGSYAMGACQFDCWNWTHFYVGGTNPYVEYEKKTCRAFLTFKKTWTNQTAQGGTCQQTSSYTKGWSYMTGKQKCDVTKAEVPMEATDFEFNKMDLTSPLIHECDGK